MKAIKAVSALAAVAVGAVAAIKLAAGKDETEATCSCCKKDKYGSLTVTAHTGCMDTTPNSLEAIRKGAENGADIVEFDLRYDDSRTAILSHNRIAPGDKPVTLDEAFAVVAEYESLHVNVDVKQTDYLEQVQSLAEKHGILQRVFFTGIRRRNVDAVKAKCPLIPYYLNIDVIKPFSDSTIYTKALISTLSSCGAIGVNVSKTGATKHFVKQIQQAGYPVSIWTPTTEDDLKRVLAMSPDNITTRNPALLCKIIGRSTSHENA